jgi:hypothetical protein
MFKHLFDMPYTEAELASYQPGSGFHYFFRSLSVLEEIGVSKAIA